MQTEPYAQAVIARQYFLDRSTETPAAFRIECVDAVPPPPPLRGEHVARRLHAVGTFVETGAAFSAFAAQGLSALPNEVTIDSEAAAIAAFYPTPDNKYVGGWYRLGPDEALVVEGTPPESRYWSLVLMSRWMESLDAQHHQVVLNSHQVALEPDGTFRIVVAHRDPGCTNWLDTDGHDEGYVFFRWMQASGVTQPTFRVVSQPSLEASR